jgi:hypothetical protein
MPSNTGVTPKWEPVAPINKPEAIRTRASPAGPPSVATSFIGQVSTTSSVKITVVEIARLKRNIHVQDDSARASNDRPIANSPIVVNNTAMASMTWSNNQMSLAATSRR